MVYDSLDILPIKLFYKIAASGDHSLLSDEGTDTEALWEQLTEAYKKYDKSSTEKILKEIELLDVKYKLALYGIHILKFDFRQDVVDALNEQGYNIDRNSIWEDLERVEKEAEGLLIKIERLEKKLPKGTVELDRVFASFATILGYDVGDYNKISVTKFYALKEQVDIKAKQNANHKKRNTRR